MSRSIAILQTARYTIKSVGNGWAYEFISHPSDDAVRSVWFQDEDATRFREEFDRLGELPGYGHDDAICDHLWDDYESISQEKPLLGA